MKTKMLLSAIFLIALFFAGCEKRNDELQNATQPDVFKLEEHQLDDLQLDEHQLALLQEYDNSSLKCWNGKRPFLILGRSAATGGGGVCGPVDENGNPTGWTLEYAGKGFAFYVGRFTYTGLNCNVGECIEGDITLTARNGDKLFMVGGPDYTMCPADPPGPEYLAWAGPGYIDGGTGKFENATGNIEWYLVLNLVPDSPNFGTVTMTGRGTITF